VGVLGVLPLALQQESEVLSLSLPPAPPYTPSNEPEPQLSKHAVSERTPMILPRVFEAQVLARRVQLKSQQLRIYWWIYWCLSQFDPIRRHPASLQVRQVRQVCQLGHRIRRTHQAHPTQHQDPRAHLNPIHQVRHQSVRCSSVVSRCLRNHWWDPGRSCGCGPTRRSAPRTR